MYNKLFTKILDSTVWLENDATRLVWITFLAVMDEDGFVALSSAGNVAARARVPAEAAEAAIKSLESPDRSDPSQEHDGRRIERVPYGWMVLNASKYRDIVQRAESMRKNRERVAKHRAGGNAHVTGCNAPVMQSEAVSEAVAVSETETKVKRAGRGTRLPTDWKPNAEQIKFCRQERPDLDPVALGARFRDHWIAQPGQKGVKVDWPATWRNWVRNEKRISVGKTSLADANRLAGEEAQRRFEEDQRAGR